MSSSSRASKRRRQGADNASGEDEPPLDLLALYQSDIGDRILSFASGADLCTLDALNKQFNTLTANQWHTVTKERFGMSNGKEGWRLGTSFLRPPVFMLLTDKDNDPEHETGDGGYGYGYYPGCPRVAANESIIVAVTSQIDDYYHSNNEMGIRDSKTLNYIRSIPSPIENSRVSICGRVGSEIIVTSSFSEICAQRGNDVQMLRMLNSGIRTIGCETHLLVANGNEILLYEVNPCYPYNDLNLLYLRQNINIAGTPCSLSWGPNQTHFITCYPHQIYVYKFDKETETLPLVKTINVDDVEINNVALAEDYIVASSSDKKIHVWNRNTGDKMVYTMPEAEQVDALCDYDLDEDEEEELLETGTAYELHFSCHGNILVSTSHIGCAICIWDMKTGRLLKRHNEANEEEGIGMLPDGIDASDLVYLKHLNAFLCMTSNMYIWSFPRNQSEINNARSIRRREEIVNTALLGLPPDHE